MIYRDFGRTGWRVSAIGLGTWNIGTQWGDVDDATAWATVRAAYDNGVNIFDAAESYGIPNGLSEERLGVALAESRAGRLEQLEIAVEPSLTTEQLEELQQGFDEGWSWACSQHWLPERLPSLQLRWTRDEG